MIVTGSRYVLIETYWNVKEKHNLPKSLGNPGINRNILECKGVWFYVVCSAKSVLIETYWNVKESKIERDRHTGSINRNILECKGRCH